MAAFIKGRRGQMMLAVWWQGKLYRPNVRPVPPDEGTEVRYSRDAKSRYTSLKKRVEAAVKDKTFTFEEFFPGFQTLQRMPLPTIVERFSVEDDFTLWGRAQAWLKTKNGLQSGGFKSYDYTLRRFLEGTPLGAMDVREIKREHIQDFVSEARCLTDENRKPNRQVTILLQKLRKIFDLLEYDDVIAKNPARRVENPKGSEKQVIHPIDLSDRQRLIAAATNPRDRAMVQIGFALGLRPQELLDLERTGIDPHGRFVVVRGTKNEGADRTLRNLPASVSTKIVEALNWLPVPLDRRPLLFRGSRSGGPIGLDNWRKRNWEPLFEAAGIDNRPPNVMRHQFAIDRLNERHTPQMVAEWMGHENARTLFRHYARYIVSTEQEAVSNG